MKPQNGDTVRVHYTGTLADGSEFDTSRGRDPLSFTLGEGSVIPGFESAVTELEVGETTTVTIPAAQAYGERIEEARQQVPLDAFGESLPQVGWGVELQGPDGQLVNAMVANIDDEFVTLDFNHPLAGEDLTFDLELVQIVSE
ncbi:MAG: peptidylprolyl isomerase [Coriobacteriia bacterium]|nr:peptidylprolyl isomerase [Coriobacteriia bacterium]MBN2847344.1 peptidylprolyl isomerase [Coriobacteriia bacterium]